MSEDNTAAPPAPLTQGDMEIINAQDDWNRQNAFIDAHAAPPAPADAAGNDLTDWLVLAASHPNTPDDLRGFLTEAVDALTAQAGEIEALKQDRTFYHRAANEELAARRAAEARIAELREALRCSREYVVDTNGATDLPIVEAIDAALAKGGEP
jgi:hypothetical protein